jgi:Ca2+-binding RTX toxin-like protein
MTGGAGDDTYVVDNVADLVTEAASEGLDTIETDVTYVLPANVERLTLTGSGGINGTGNGLNNTLTGNTKNNVLDGGVGMDAMAGGAGNDTYVVDDQEDTVTEGLNQGTDTIETSVSLVLPVNVEKLTLTGTVGITGIGNALNNTLAGNSAANWLDGVQGTDTMAGGAGDDTYVVDTTGDTVQEGSNAGLDTIRSLVTYTLPSNVENLTLVGTGVINGTGNTLANVLQGNGAANVLTGGKGDDTYLFARGAGQDVIQDADTTAGNRDTLAFASDLDPLDLIISRSVNSLRIAVHDASDRVDVQNWYGGAANQVEVLRAGDGRQLLSTQVEQLVQAMASYSAQSGLTWDQAVAQRPDDVEAVLTAYWQPSS